MKKCSIEGCNNIHEARGYCHKHYERFRSGRNVKLSIRDPNRYILDKDDGLCWIILCSRKLKEVARTVIDIEMFEEVIQHKWRLDMGIYVRNNSVGFLHNFIYGESPDGYWVDHIDKDPLNNTSANLRKATYSQNCYNRNMMCSNTSGVTGVHLNKKKLWVARISKNGRRTYLGSFKKYEDAIEARRDMEKVYKKHGFIR